MEIKMTDLLNIRHKGDPCEMCGLSQEDTVVDECLGALIGHIRDIKVKIAFPMAQLDTLTKKAKQHARLYSSLTGETGYLLKLDGVKVKITHPKKPRVYWDGKGLEVYSRMHPAVLMFKTEKMTAPAVSIQVE
jgi:hypothetical protein